eukprot:3873737-Rhodomonas_salina.1
MLPGQQRVLWCRRVSTGNDFGTGRSVLEMTRSSDVVSNGKCTPSSVTLGKGCHVTRKKAEKRKRKGRGGGTGKKQAQNAPSVPDTAQRAPSLRQYWVCPGGGYGDVTVAENGAKSKGGARLYGDAWEWL